MFPPKYRQPTLLLPASLSFIPSASGVKRNYVVQASSSEQKRYHCRLLLQHRGASAQHAKNRGRQEIQEAELPGMKTSELQITEAELKCDRRIGAQRCT